MTPLWMSQLFKKKKPHSPSGKTKITQSAWLGVSAESTTFCSLRRDDYLTPGQQCIERGHLQKLAYGKGLIERHVRLKEPIISPLRETKKKSILRRLCEKQKK